MGRITAIAGALALLAGVATVQLPAPHWFLALYVTLLLAALTVLCGFGWWLKTGLGGGPASTTWAIWGMGVSATILAGSFVLGPGPGRIAAQAHVTIDLFAWTVSAAGLAAALTCAGYGLFLARGPKTWLAAVGAGAVAASVLAVQPLLRALGLPHLGPVGSAIAVAAALVAVLGPLRRRQ